jgi:murein DD-endopeptidase MepM/ murein hydrolase activator NlpD
VAPPAPPVFPVQGATGYGEWEARYGHFRNGHVHEGQDVFAPAGSPLVAVRDAVVIEKGSGDGRGHHIALYSAAEDETYVYLHLQRPSRVDPGDAVAAGEPVGRVGCSGSCSGDHLHFEVRRGRGLTGRSTDPLPLLRVLQRR